MKANKYVGFKAPVFTPCIQNTWYSKTYSVASDVALCQAPEAISVL